ncbi:MAG: peroxidase-related enzyme [Elusimicrobia bacterium]|nr:peroxidase-related enzyme [Elusimicrobiota bacterium]
MSAPRPWIRVIAPEAAEGTLRAVYDETLKKRGRLAAVHMIHSLNPESLRAHMDLYMTLMFGASPVPRRTREMVAVAVSRSNGCAYCVAHHADVLARYEKRSEYIQAIREGRWEALVPADAVVCRHAEKLTRQPGSMGDGDIAALKSSGLTDEEILDITQIAAYFNFVNRIVLGLGVDLEDADSRRGFKY